MNKGQLLYEGKAKKIFQTTDPEHYWVQYKNDATAFNGEKKGHIEDKGRLNNRISAIFFELLGRQGIPHHFVKLLSETEQLVRKVDILPVEVVVRNLAAGSMAKRLGLEDGLQLPQPVVEYYYKEDALGDPLIIEDHIGILELATQEQVQSMKKLALQVNEILSRHLADINIILVDFKLEFGVTEAGEILLADEVSPDTCRFWDKHTKKRLDKDRFRQGLGQVEEAYEEILQRLGGK